MFVIDNELISLVRIGQTGEISNRQGQYRTHNPSSLYLIFFHSVFDKEERKKIESDYLYKFEKYRLQNTWDNKDKRRHRDWFHLKPVVEKLGLDWKRMNEER